MHFERAGTYVEPKYTWNRNNSREKKVIILVYTQPIISSYRFNVAKARPMISTHNFFLAPSVFPLDAAQHTNGGSYTIVEKLFCNLHENRMIEQPSKRHCDVCHRWSIGHCEQFVIDLDSKSISRFIVIPLHTRQTPAERHCAASRSPIIRLKKR